MTLCITPPLSPFRPQPLRLLRDRVPLALRRVVQLNEAQTVGAVPPEFIFDFGDGLRLILMLEQWEPGAPPRLHVSGSWQRPPVPARRMTRVKIVRSRGFDLLQGNRPIVDREATGVAVHFWLQPRAEDLPR